MSINFRIGKDVWVTVLGGTKYIKKALKMGKEIKIEELGGCKVIIRSYIRP